MTNVIAPTIPHATVTVNERNRVVIRMDSDYLFWDKTDFEDENGVFVAPPIEEMQYFSYGVFAPDWNFDNIVIVERASVPADQIFGVTPPTEKI